MASDFVARVKRPTGETATFYDSLLFFATLTLTQLYVGTMRAQGHALKNGQLVFSLDQLLYSVSCKFVQFTRTPSNVRQSFDRFCRTNPIP